MPEETYQEKQVRILESFKVNRNDQSNNKIKKIFVKRDEYVIYEIATNMLSESLKIYIMTKEEEEDDPAGLLDNFNKIKIELNEVKAILYKAKRENAFKQIISSAIAHGMEGEREQAIQQLIDIKNRINTEYNEEFISKVLYIGTSFVISLFFIIISILVYTNTLGISSKYNLLKELIYISTFGIFGGLISISLKLKSIELEKEINQFYFIFYGIERMFIAIIGSIFIYFIIKSGLAFDFINNLSNPLYAYAVIAVLSGFSETLIPDVLKKMENKIDTQEDS